MTYFAWFIFICAAILEVGGDAIVRKGLRGNNLIIVLVGCHKHERRCCPAGMLCATQPDEF